MRLTPPKFLVSSLLLTLAGGAATAMAKPCDLAIEGTDAMQYSKKELVIPKDCTDVTLTLKHTGTLPKAAMGHNWILTADGDMAGVLSAGMTAGLAADYQPKDDKRIIAATKVVGGGESATATFKTSALVKGTSYKYFCSFPGHSGLMSGVLKTQ